jgi:hypothetical protein
MKLRKFNESVDDDIKILTESSTIITYEFEDITFEIFEESNTIRFDISNWMKKYGNICVGEGFLEFTRDYIKLIELFHEFIRSLDDYKLYITEFPKLTDVYNKYITLKYISPTSKLSLVKNNIPIDPIPFKQILKDRYQINFRELLTTGKKTLILNGLDKDFYNNKNFEKFLLELVKGDNKLIGIGYHWLSTSNSRPWEQFKKQLNFGSEKLFNIDDIPYSKHTSFFGALHYNISLEFENEIRIIKK